MRVRTGLANLFLVAAAGTGAAAQAREPAALHASLDQLAREGKFSGAVVIRGPEGVRFARGYGLADPFAGRAFTPATPADSGSLAKPVTSAAVLILTQEGEIEIDAPGGRLILRNGGAQDNALSSN